MRKTTAFTTLALLIVLFFGVVVINNELLGHYRVDLTEDKVYSLSPGSQDVLDDLDEPIVLYFFFSDSASKGMTALRNYANRVQSLLEEYASRANGKITLKIIDPEPFSESEDLAVQFGLTGATLGPIGEAIYFGLAGTNAVDDQHSIGFFDPQKETFLEYDISKLIYQLSDPEPVSVTLLTDVNLLGGQNPMSGQYTPPMTFYSQLNQLYKVTTIGSDAMQLPDETDVLVVIHPQNLSESLLYSIDQFAMKQGRILLFMDSHFESDPMAMMSAMGANSSVFPLLEKWGVRVDTSKVVLDARLGLEIRTPEGGVSRHPGIVGLTAGQLNREDIVTANLELINGASFAPLSLIENSQLRLTPLAYSSPASVAVNSSDYALTREPQVLQRMLDTNKQQFTLAARVTGNANSAFQSAPKSEEVSIVQAAHASQTSQLNLIVFTDADLLADRFWVQQTNFFGETLFTPFANNGDAIINASENLAGSNALISIRGRGTYARPFVVVQALEAKAQARFREQEERLQAQLQQTEAQLAQLQNAQSESGALTLTTEQQAALDDFIAQRAAIRRELRDVRYQLERDIDTLGNYLKLLNIAASPVLLVTLLWLFSRLVRRRAGKKVREEISA
ncbi:ABC transporter [Aestuariibacter sp. GS-14]|uniref:GldG family protein n=2 Tax=Alteromonadaceae TaxID=72275 RepID=UPI00112E3B9F|nr:GldG family protein [Aestuariibacter sp. GS-14]TPV56042.1 ABC transporter [Aestuariibacter sp. GS-14]